MENVEMETMIMMNSEQMHKNLIQSVNRNVTKQRDVVLSPGMGTLAL